MNYTLSQRFYFEAAHTLKRYIDAEPSRRIHGHTYLATVSLSATPDADTGMVVDLGHLRREIEIIRERLDHRFLDEIEDLGPGTLENLCTWLWKAFEAIYADKVVAIEVRREASGDACRLTR